MFKLDDQFLADLGLDDLPQEQKTAFLQHIYSELEMRVGEKLTENMSDEMLDEFGNFVDRNVDGMKQWYDANLPDYQSQPDYQALTANNPDTDPGVIMSEYGAMKWLQLNRPEYPQVVAGVLEDLKNEIRANKDAILGGASGQSAPRVPDGAGQDVTQG
jgi:hypothetical protein